MIADRPATTEVLARLCPPPRDRWRELVRGDVHAFASSAPEWCSSVCRFTGSADVSAIYLLSDGREFAVPMLLRRTRAVRMNYSLLRGWGYGGIIGPDLDAGAIAAILTHAGAGALTTTAFRPNPLLVPMWDEAMEMLQTTRMRRFPHLDHVLDLGGGYDHVWQKRFRPEARTLVRRADRNPDLRVEHATGGGLLAEFYDLHVKTVSRWNRNGEKARIQPRERFMLPAAVLGDDLHVWLASISGRPAAAIIVLNDGMTMTYSAGAVDDELTGTSGASTVVHARAIEFACSAGASFYHMGETDQKSGLAQFKTRLGAEAYASAEYIVERLPIRIWAEKIRAAKSRLQTARPWQTLPRRIRVKPSDRGNA